MSRKKRSYKGLNWLVWGVLIFISSMLVYLFNDGSLIRGMNTDLAIILVMGIPIVGLFMAAKGSVDLKRSNSLETDEKRPRIIRTKLVAVDGIKQTRKSGTISGAVVGGILAGGLGAMVGALGNTKDTEYNVDNKYTFLVIYDNGEQKLETVSEKYDKRRFDLLVSKLVVEE